MIFYVTINSSTVVLYLLNFLIYLSVRLRGDRYKSLWYVGGALFFIAVEVNQVFILYLTYRFSHPK